MDNYTNEATLGWTCDWDGGDKDYVQSFSGKTSSKTSTCTTHKRMGD
jgi:hypothetical protein